jgi:hypothetical protein
MAAQRGISMKGTTYERKSSSYAHRYGREFQADENVMVMTLEQKVACQRLLWELPAGRLNNARYGAAVSSRIICE